MSRTYRAILTGDQLEWVGARPETNGRVTVRIIVEEPDRMTRGVGAGPEMARALEELAQRGTIGEDVDAAAWQRKSREDRPLPEREN